MKSRLWKLIRCRRGNTAIVLSAVMPMMIGAGALGVDVVEWALVKRHLQRQADTGAIAGANAVMQKQPAQGAVDRSLVFNNHVTLLSRTVENAPTVGAYAGNNAAVRVIVTARPQLAFVSFFMTGPTTISAEATAMALPQPTYCLVALEDTPQYGFDFSGATGVTADCGLMANSRRKQGVVNFGGSAASVRAPVVGAVGGLPPASNWHSSTQLMPNQAKLPDPYASAPEASTFITSPCNTALSAEGNGNSNNSNNVISLRPGCYTGGRISARADMAPGVYVINGGTLTIDGNANLTGTGVTFVLTGSSQSTIAKLSITGTAVMNLTAPTTGTLKDILIYQDRRAKYTGTENSFTGNASSVLTGGIYLPGSNLTFTGNSSATGVCLRMVASKLTFTGSSVANITCSGTQSNLLFGQQVRLVA